VRLADLTLNNSLGPKIFKVLKITVLVIIYGALGAPYVKKTRGIAYQVLFTPKKNKLTF
jgi:hypothetical protein